MTTQGPGTRAGPFSFQDASATSPERTSSEVTSKPGRTRCVRYRLTISVALPRKISPTAPTARQAGCNSRANHIRTGPMLLQRYSDRSRANAKSGEDSLRRSQWLPLTAGDADLSGNPRLHNDPCRRRQSRWTERAGCAGLDRNRPPSVSRAILLPAAAPSDLFGSSSGIRPLRGK